MSDKPNEAQGKAPMEIWVFESLAGADLCYKCPENSEYLPYIHYVEYSAYESLKQEYEESVKGWDAATQILHKEIEILYQNARAAQEEIDRLLNKVLEVENDFIMAGRNNEKLREENTKLKQDNEKLKLICIAETNIYREYETRGAGLIAALEAACVCDKDDDEQNWACDPCKALEQWRKGEL